MVPIRTNPTKCIDALVEHDRTPFRDRRNPAVEVPVGPVQALRCLVEREVTQGVARARGHIGAEEFLDGAVVNPERSLFIVSLERLGLKKRGSLRIPRWLGRESGA